MSIVLFICLNKCFRKGVAAFVFMTNENENRFNVIVASGVTEVRQVCEEPDHDHGMRRLLLPGNTG